MSPMELFCGLMFFVMLFVAPVCVGMVMLAVWLEKRED